MAIMIKVEPQQPNIYPSQEPESQPPKPSSLEMLLILVVSIFSGVVLGTFLVFGLAGGLGHGAGFGGGLLLALFAWPAAVCVVIGGCLFVLLRYYAAIVGVIGRLVFIVVMTVVSIATVSLVTWVWWNGTGRSAYQRDQATKAAFTFGDYKPTYVFSNYESPTEGYRSVPYPNQPAYILYRYSAPPGALLDFYNVTDAKLPPDFDPSTMCTYDPVSVPTFKDRLTCHKVGVAEGHDVWSDYKGPKFQQYAVYYVVVINDTLVSLEVETANPATISSDEVVKILNSLQLNK